jgi:hypothetical protein
MEPNEPLDAALADAVAVGELPLGRVRSEGGDELLGVGFTQPVTNPPLTGTQRSGANAVSRSADLGLCLAKLLHRADQRICKVPAV